MASRASLTTKINTDLATGTSITAAEHRGVEQAIVDSLAPYNRGTITVGEIPITVKTYARSGDISSAVCSTVATGILCTMDNAMPSTNYLVRLHIESLGSIATDGILFPPVFSIVSTTQFRFTVIEYGSSQNIKIHVEVISLD
jgi:hypothetical protein